MYIDKKNTNTTLVEDYLELHKECTDITKNYYNYVVKTQATQKLGVYLPKLSTIETYDELIKYVEEMYVHGMILGDEFVMKPTDEQRIKIENSIPKNRFFPEGIMHMWNIVDHKLKIIYASFGVKIIIK